MAKVWRNPWTCAPCAVSVDARATKHAQHPVFPGASGDPLTVGTHEQRRRRWRPARAVGGHEVEVGAAPPVGDFDEEASPGSLVKFGIDVMPVVRCECRCDQMCTA